MRDPGVTQAERLVTDARSPFAGTKDRCAEPPVELKGYLRCPKYVTLRPDHRFRPLPFRDEGCDPAGQRQEHEQKALPGEKWADPADTSSGGGLLGPNSCKRK